MRSEARPARALAATLLALGLGACNAGRNVADDCWINKSSLESANRFRLGLRARNVAADDGAWAEADARIARARKELRACEDGARGTGRPDVADLGGGHGPAAGAHASDAGGHDA